MRFSFSCIKTDSLIKEIIVYYYYNKYIQKCNCKMEISTIIAIQNENFIQDSLFRIKIIFHEFKIPLINKAQFD